MRSGKKQKSDVVLSIGIIFRNEIRCLERCMESLGPLREKIPCELVMADTGSDDGSREVAEKFADILFDFPWIDDFSAARNAVMEHCSGRWFISIDCDEWMDEDISELVHFLTGPDGRKYIAASIKIRNYSNKELDRYSDMTGLRMVRMDTGVRYENAIHEAFKFTQNVVIASIKTLLHHDGYLLEGGPDREVKRNRNMKLLEEMLDKDPHNLRILTECVESARDSAEQKRYLVRAVEGVKEKWKNWNQFGHAILRYDVLNAQGGDTHDLKEHAALAVELFPNSPFTTIDVSYIMHRALSEKGDYKGAIPWGEQYLQAIAEYRNNSDKMNYDLLFGTLMMAAPANEMEVHILLSDAYYREKEYEKASVTLFTLDISTLSGDLFRNYVGILMNLHSHGQQDLSEHMAKLWDCITAPGVDEKWSQERKNAIVTTAGSAFQKPWRENETKKGRRHAYTLFLPLEGKCETGLAAAVLETEDPAELEQKLLTVDHWESFSIHALIHALERGVSFPLPGKHLNLEEFDKLADRMSKIGEELLPLAIKSAEHVDTPEKLCWARGLLLAALTMETERLAQMKAAEKTAAQLGGEIDLAFAWEDKTMSLVRAFAATEKTFLSRCYTPAVLSQEGVFMLPSMHRFGWYCAQAFQLLDKGDAAGYAHQLRESLNTCKEMKPVVEFLWKYTPQLQKPKPTGELLALAETVRMMLSAYPADDPTIVTIKQSPAYLQVAHLIEGPDLLPVGGWAQ